MQYFLSCEGCPQEKKFNCHYDIYHMIIAISVPRSVNRVGIFSYEFSDC